MEVGFRHRVKAMLMKHVCDAHFKYGQCSQPFGPLTSFLERPLIMGLIYGVAILSRETVQALFYNPQLRSEKLGSDARQVKQRLL